MKLNTFRNIFIAFFAMLFLSSFARAVDLCYYKLGDNYIPSHSVALVKFSPTGRHSMTLVVRGTTGMPSVIEFTTQGPTPQEHKAQFGKVMSQCNTYNHLTRNDGTQAPFNK